MDATKKQATNVMAFLLALLCIASAPRSALAADVVNSTDTTWRFVTGEHTFANGLSFTFSDARMGGIVISPWDPGKTTASPSQTINALGSVSFIALNGTGNQTIGAYIEQRITTKPPQSLKVTGETVTLKGEYTGGAKSGYAVAGLSLAGSGTYNPARLIGAYAGFNNTNTEISAIVNPTGSFTGQIAALNADHNAGAVFNGNASLILTTNENVKSAGAVLKQSASHIEFNGAHTSLQGTSNSMTNTDFYGVYGDGDYRGGILYTPQTGLLFNSKETQITVTGTGAASLRGMYVQGGRTQVTNATDTFSIAVSAETGSNAPIIRGIEAWNHEHLDIQAKETHISTNSQGAVINSFNNTALMTWTNGSITIGGGKAVLSTSGNDNGGITLYALGQKSNLTLDPAFAGNGDSDITINADDITIASTTTGTGETIAAYVWARDGNATIHVNSDKNGADQGKTLNVTGDIYAAASGTNNPFSGKAYFNFGNANSQFTGKTMYWPNDGDDSQINLGLTNGARWNMTKNSSVTNFTAGGGHTYLGTDASHFASLTRDESDFTPTQLWIANLHGADGNFYLRADIDGDKADSVYVQNGTGSHNLFVRSHGAEPSAMAMNQYLARKDAGDATFTLGNAGGKVDAGVYMYELAERDATGAPTAHEWYLKRTDQKSPTAQAEASLAGLASNYALWAAQHDNLRNRLGEVHNGAKTGLWMRGFAEKDTLDGLGGTEFTQNSYGGAMGYDFLAGTSGASSWLAGMQLRVSHADQDVSGSYGGTGKVDSMGAGLYATWLHADGWYADAVATADRYDFSITSTMLDGRTVKDSQSTYGLGASLEAGRKFTFGHSEDGRSAWFAEPQVQLSYFWLKGKDTTASNGMKIEREDANLLTGRAGLVLGKKIALGEDANDPRFIQPSIKAGVVHEFAGDQTAYLNDIKQTSSLEGTRAYYGVGLDWQASENLRVYAQATREQGEHFTREVNVSAGLKWEF